MALEKDRPKGKIRNYVK